MRTSGLILTAVASCGCYVAGETPVHAPRYTVNLDAPAENRWDEAVEGLVNTYGT